MSTLDPTLIWHQYGEGWVPHRALVRLLARVSTHVHHQHVLGFEGSQLPGAAPPMAHELLPLPMDMFTVDMLRREKTRLSGVPDATQTRDISLSFSPPFILLSTASWGS